MVEHHKGRLFPEAKNSSFITQKLILVQITFKLEINSTAI